MKLMWTKNPIEFTKNPIYWSSQKRISKKDLHSEGVSARITVLWTPKMWKSNVKSVRVKTEGGAKKMYVCTSCLKSGCVERA